MDTAPSTSPRHEPVHVLYGGAHLFRRDTPDKLGRIARAALDAHGTGAAIFPNEALRARVAAKLEARAVEALCIDFEDGFGPRPDAEEDAEAVRAGAELGSAQSGTRIGLRIKALSGPTAARGARTLETFLASLAAAGPLPESFSVTLPKVEETSSVGALERLLARLEAAHGWPRGGIGIELMIETPRALLDADGRVPIARLVDAAAGRCTAVHLGAYDLTASLGVPAPAQRLDHPACDAARLTMTTALAGRDVAVFDGATTTLPLGTTRDVQAAWELHARNVRRAVDFGIFQGWDLHPAQLPARYAALSGYFEEHREAMAKRLANFIARATQATRVGQEFDDAATGHGLLGFFRRGLACGAFDESDLETTTLTRTELASRSFAPIVSARSPAR